MSSLAYCLKKLGTKLSESEKKSWQAKGEKYKKSGMAEKEVVLTLAGDVEKTLDELDTERIGIVEQIKGQQTKKPEVKAEAKKLGVIPGVTAKPKSKEEKVEVTPTPKGEDVTVGKLDEIRHESRANERYNVSKAKAPKDKNAPLSKSEKDVMAKLGDEVELGPLSEALLYAKPLSSLSKTYHAAAIKLIDRGIYKVYREVREEYPGFTYILRKVEIAKAIPGEKVSDIDQAKERVKVALKDERGSFSFETKEGPPVFDDLVIIGKDIYQRGYNKLETFTAQMKKVLGDIWESIKHIASQLYERSKEILKSERGAVTIREAGERVEKAPSIIKEKFGRTETTAKEKIDAGLKSIKTKEFWDSAITQTVDKLHPIKGKIGDKAYKLHRLLTGSEATFAMVLEHGKLKLINNEVLAVDTRKKGFMPFLEKQGKDWKNILYWTAAKRAEAIEAADRAKGLTRADKEWRERWLNAKEREQIFAEFGASNDKKMLELSKELKAFNDNILDIAEQSGLIDPEARRTWAQDFYVPFYRIFEDEQAKAEFLKAPHKSAKFISAQIKKLKGAETKIGDPLENLFHNWMHLIQESTRNIARAEAFNSAVLQNSDLIEEVGFKDLHSFYRDGKNVFIHKKTNQDVLMFQRKGKPVYFRVTDADLFNALSGVNSQSFDNFVMKLMNKTKRVLTYGATFGPAFRVANLLRDTMHTALIQKSFKPFIDSAKGLVKAWNEDQDFIEFMASGYGFGSSYVRADDPATASKFIQRIMRKEGTGVLDRILSTGKKMLDFWEKVGSVSENAARVQIYATLRGQGESILTSGFEGRDLLDFTMSGAAGTVQFLIQTVPFLNARMQGLYRLGRAVADPTNRKNFAIRGSMLMAASLTLWAIYKDDDKYKELEDWDKWSYYHFWIGDKHFRIPKPFEVGAMFSSLPTTLADVLYENDETKHIAEFIGYTAMETFAIGLPQALKPLAEQWANKSFFTGRPIVSAHLAGLKPEEQKEPWTSETLQLAGRLGISPKRAEALIRGYFSVFGMFLLGGVDILTHNVFDFPENPTLRVDDYPLLGRFVKEREPARYTKQQTWFYNTLKEIDTLVKTVNYYKQIGEPEKAERIKEKEPTKLQFMGIFRQTRTRLGHINKQIKLVMIDKNLSAEQKREQIDSLSLKRNRLVKQVYEKYTGKAKKNIVESEIERLSGLGLMAYPGMPSKYISIKGEQIDLNYDQYNTLVTESEKLSKKRLDNLVGTAYWKMLSDKEKASRINRIIRESRKKSRNKIKRQLGKGVVSTTPWGTTTGKPAWQRSMGLDKKPAWQQNITL